MSEINKFTLQYNFSVMFAFKAIEAHHLISIKNSHGSSVKWGHLAHLESNSTNTILSTNPMGSSSPL